MDSHLQMFHQQTLYGKYTRYTESLSKFYIFECLPSQVVTAGAYSIKTHNHMYM